MRVMDDRGQFILGEQDASPSILSTERDVTIRAPAPQRLPRDASPLGGFTVGEEGGSRQKDRHTRVSEQPNIT